MSTVNSLLNVAKQISDIYDSNGHFVEGLARRIDKTKKPLFDLTVAEFINLIDKYRAFYNCSLSGGGK